MFNDFVYLKSFKMTIRSRYTPCKLQIDHRQWLMEDKLDMHLGTSCHKFPRQRQTEVTGNISLTQGTLCPIATISLRIAVFFVSFDAILEANI